MLLAVASLKGSLQCMALCEDISSPFKGNQERGQKRRVARSESMTEPFRPLAKNRVRTRKPMHRHTTNTCPHAEAQHPTVFAPEAHSYDCRDYGRRVGDDLAFFAMLCPPDVVVKLGPRTPMAGGTRKASWGGPWAWGQVFVVCLFRSKCLWSTGHRWQIRWCARCST